MVGTGDWETCSDAFGSICLVVAFVCGVVDSFCGCLDVDRSLGVAAVAFGVA